MASGFGIDHQRIPNHLISEMPAEIHRCTQIDCASLQQPAQLFFDFSEAKETDPRPGSKFNQDVDVTRN
jgi:hypothetical protein